ncbi:serine carboxypeptidase-like 45 isoform X1 [Cucumis melo var. makuwa]|uniref:Serine carboxypeptidase-like 45 isoform X1 n=1 Tax=Cucumis melo var. makuwa TaxID=1194695 RepID=A0A5D3DPA5_CUCMM|nr:serine carboxypeptidase-like 45 isoform X1 [Cucumis melo var. makuwa]TYK25473.1 serine carboxypeptidase-like 45 isoform X1 [Cucumis melo var. makuwa]
MGPRSNPSMAVIAMVALAFSIVLGPRSSLVMANQLADHDRITSLPNQPMTTTNFKQFGGYVTVNEKEGRALFYYFVEAESMASSKPLVLWFNGDTLAGCSSLGGGALLEHGPFKINGEVLIKNHYSWNTEANMLYVESPAGVGFSYSKNKSFYSNITDAISVEDNFMFLQRWLEKFPQYKKRDLYIAGEAYAGGHFVPLLAQLIVNSNLKLKLKGIAIGNPLLDIQVDANALSQYWWSHALISDAAFNLLTSVCNASRLVTEGITNSLSRDCISVATNVSKELSPAIDYFDVAAGDACPSANASLFGDLNRTDPLRFTLLQTFIYGQSGQKDRDPCAGDTVAKYLNRHDVQKALHAKLIGFSTWRICRFRKEWKYNLRNRLVPTIGVVGALVKSKIRVLVYSGDQDSALPFSGTRTLVNSLANSMNLCPTVRYRPWFSDKKVGGWTEEYGKYLSYAIVRGASQKTAQTQPKRSLLLFKSFLAGKPLPEA